MINTHATHSYRDTHKMDAEKLPTCFSMFVQGIISGLNVPTSNKA